VGRVGQTGNTEGELDLCVVSQLPFCPLYTEFASALKVIVVFVGQPKQGWVLSSLS